MSANPLAVRVSNFLVTWRWPLLMFGVVVTLAAWLPASRLDFDRSIENMFAPDDPLLVPFARLQRTFGGDEVALACYVDPGLMSADGSGMKRLSRLTERLQQTPGVEAVVSLSNNPFLGKNPLANATAMELFEGYLIGADRQTTAVVCMLEAESVAARPRAETIDALRQIVAAHDPSGVIAGEPVMVVDGFRYIDEDGFRLQWTSTLLLMAVILLCFRSFRWVLVPVAIVQVTLLWTKASLVLSRLHLSMVSSMLAAIVTVVGVATVLHLIVHFRASRQSGLRPRQALVESGGLLMMPIVWAILTDVAGFGALLAASVGPVQDFGAMMAVGAMLVLASVALFLPGLALAGGFDADPKRAWGERGLDLGLRGMLDELLRHPKSWGVVIFVVSSLAAAGSRWLEVETDFTRNFRASSPIVRSYEFVETHLGGAGVWDLIVPAPQPLDLAFLQRIRTLQHRLRTEAMVEGKDGGQGPGLTKVLSLVDIIDANPLGQLDRLPEFMRQSALKSMLVALESKLPVIYHSLCGIDPQQPDRYYLRIMLRARERQPSQRKQQLIERVRTIAREEFPDAEVTGFFVLLTNLIDSMLRDQWLTFGIATSAIWGMMLVAFRSVKLSIVALLPNVVPITVVTGMMGWLGFPINMGAAMIAAVSMGLSVDSSVHYLVEFTRFRAAGHSLNESLHAVHQSAGRAMVFSTLALIVGFGALIQSQFVPTIYFGVLVCLTMLGGLVGNLIMLPLLLKLVRA